MFQAKVERETGRKLKALRTDNGMEYCANVLRNKLLCMGIRAERTNVYSLEMNGVAERLNRNLLDSARTMLIADHLSAEWWAELLVTAAYLKNRVAHSGINGEVPDTLYYKRS